MRLKGFSVRRIASDFTRSKYLLRAIASGNQGIAYVVLREAYSPSGKLYEPIFLSTSPADSERIKWISEDGLYDHLVVKFPRE